MASIWFSKGIYLPTKIDMEPVSFLIWVGRGMIKAKTKEAVMEIPIIGKGKSL